MAHWATSLLCILLFTLTLSSPAAAEPATDAVAMTYVIPSEDGVQGCGGTAGPLQTVAVDLAVGALSSPIQTLEIDLGVELFTQGAIVFDHLELPSPFIGDVELVEGALRITLSAADGCHSIPAAEHVARVVFNGDVGWQRIYLGNWPLTGVPHLTAITCSGESSSLSMSQCTEITINDPHVPIAVQSFGVIKAQF